MMLQLNFQDFFLAQQSNLFLIHVLLCYTTGDHEIKVRMSGKEVPRSPFRVKVADPKQVVVDCPSFANLGNTANIKGKTTCDPNYKLLDRVGMIQVTACTMLIRCYRRTVSLHIGLKYLLLAVMVATVF